MREARLFDANKNVTIVKAEDVKEGKFDRNENYVDIEEEFRVTYVSDCKGHSGPYFRLYLAREEYKKLSKEQKDRYDILRNQRRYNESPWHKEWKEKFSSFCLIEKSIRNEETNKYKIADAIYLDKKTIIELQHSYIANDFEERNNHYSSLGYKVIWLYDLPNARLKKIGDNTFEILEDNARGFFRIAEKPENLINYPVFIQTHDKKIYWIRELKRKDIENNLKSTIRIFKPVLILNESDFVEGIKQEKYLVSSVYELWNPKYKSIIIKEIKEDKIVIVRNDKEDPSKMSRNYQSGNIGCNYMRFNEETKKYSQTSTKFYDIGEERAHDKRWVLLEATNKQ